VQFKAEALLGHVSLAMVEPDSNRVCYASLWSGAWRSPAEDENLEFRAPDAVIPLAGLDVGAMLNWLGQNKRPRFQLQSNGRTTFSCATMAQRLLVAGGFESKFAPFAQLLAG
jgi:hypothetical protein